MEQIAMAIDSITPEAQASLLKDMVLQMSGPTAKNLLMQVTVELLVKPSKIALLVRLKKALRLPALPVRKAWAVTQTPPGPPIR